MARRLAAAVLGAVFGAFVSLGMRVAASELSPSVEGKGIKRFGSSTGEFSKSDSKAGIG